MPKRSSLQTNSAKALQKNERGISMANETTSPPDGGTTEATPPEPPNWKCELTLITPEWAQHVVTHGKYNRRESVATWRRYARDMANGKWVFNGAPIILNGSVDDPGILLDGYHRLMAIIYAKVSIWMLVASGVEDLALHTLDAGRIRSLGQRLEIDGEHAPKVLAELIKFLTLYRDLRAFSGATYTPLEHYDTLDNEPDTRLVAKQLVRKMPVPWLRAGLLGCCWYLFAEKDADKAKEFCESIITGENLITGHPAYTFRDWVSRLDDKSRRTARIANALIDCWNRFRRGETITRLRPPVDCPEIE
jgi:hypothetical protein